MDNGDYGGIGAIEDPSPSYSNESRGTRADVLVGSSAWCQRINSVYVVSASGQGSFEFGWLIGYSRCSGYTGTFYTQPTLFYWSTTDGGLTRCQVWGTKHPAGGQYDSFRVSDINANTYWGSFWDGAELQPDGINMDFSRGFNQVAMERGHHDDICTSYFNELNEYHDGNGWTRWDGLTSSAAADQDPACHFSKVNNYTGRILPD